MIAAAVGSYLTTKKPVHEANHFSFHPIKEVAILFVGIFGTMMPALDWLACNAGRLGSATPATFYFGSGTLSSVLDNAPTYLSFMSALFGVCGTTNMEVLLAQHPAAIAAVSVGSVFFGANTYIGNGPISWSKPSRTTKRSTRQASQTISCGITLPFMLPMLLIVWLLFFRH